MGAGRCGSTILSIILGSHPDIETVGEIKTWPKHKGLPRDRNINEENYKFWEKILKEYMKKDAYPLDFNSLEHIYSEIENHLKILSHLLGRIDTETLNHYLHHIHNLLLSIQKVSGKKVILDSSKNICRAYTLLSSNIFNIKVIHLIRDPRGTVWSFMKKGLEQETKNTLRAIFDYILLNGTSTLIRYMFSDKVIKIKYEDLIKEPTEIIKKILCNLNLDDGNVAEMVENGAEFDVNHLIDGNRIRKNKNIRFIPDEGWKKNLPLSQRIITTILALPIYKL